jgi:hypothetical protein
MSVACHSAGRFRAELTAFDLIRRDLKDLSPTPEVAQNLMSFSQSPWHGE